MRNFVRLFAAAAALASFWSSAPARAQAAETMEFTYQDNLEPWPTYACRHEKASVGVYEWDVTCDVGGAKHTYSVHLALTFYPKTRFGGGAYELLYWVTDWTDKLNPKDTSVTTWTHLASTDARAAVMEASLGVENDRASLKLVLSAPPRGR